MTLTVAHLNRVLAAGHRRAEELEPRLQSILEPILERAGVAAARKFSGQATDHLTAAIADLRRGDRAALESILAAAPPDTGVRALVCGVYEALALTSAAGPAGRTMICVKPRPEEAAAIVDPDGEPAENLHVTLVYLGELDGDLAEIADAIRPVAATHAPLSGVVAGYGQFGTPDPGTPPVGLLLPDVPGLVELRVAVTEALQRAGVGYARDHGFLAHATVDLDPEPGELEEMLARAYGRPLHFDELLLVREDTEVVPIPLVGTPPVTAAAGPPGWTAPAGAEVLDVEALVASLRTKTDPVRLAVIESVMRPALDAAGIAWDVTNPFTARVLAQSGSQIVGIAETTQLNVMRIVSESYEQGLSIADTAKAIRVGMAEASTVRARAIARTELVGATNGGSLAATQIVSAATGDKYSKVWMTAPGARHPRHEGYEGLDGQLSDLDGYFDVGGASLQYPGDPDGPADEVVNCFPAETLVEMPALRAVMRRWYEGDLVRVHLASGDVLASTPNHPVLRACGRWTPIGALKEGEYLVGASGLGGTAGEPDPDRPPIEIGEAFRLANITGGAHRISLRPPDLHGDGANSEIEVVSLNGSLLLDHEAATEEEVAQFGLALTALARLRLSGGDVAPLLNDSMWRRADAAAGFIRGQGEPSSLPVTHAAHAYSVRLGSGPHGETQVAEAPHDSRATHTHRLAHPEDARPARVALLEIVKIEREPFQGLVYNLDTGAGWYTASNIACRNCRCTMSYDDAAGDVTSVDDGEDAGPSAVAPAIPAIPAGPAPLSDLESGDSFLYQGHRFKVLGEKDNGVEVQHLKTKKRQIAAKNTMVERPPPPKQARLVGKAAEAYLNRTQRGYLEKLTDVELRDIENYVGTSYRTINGDLRAGRELGGTTAKRVANIDTAMAKSAALDDDVTLWRGTDSWRSVFKESDLDDLVGKVVTDNGYASTTTRKAVAEGSTGVGAQSGKFRAVIKIRAPRGQHGVWVNGITKATVSGEGRGIISKVAQEEGEFILPRGQRFKVVSVKKGLVPEIEVELVP